MKTQRWIYALALLAVLVVVVVARSYLTSSGVPHRVFEREDELHYVDQAVRYLNGRWETNYFVNPTLTAYVLYGLSVATGWVLVAFGTFESYAEFVLEATLNPYFVTVIGRLLTVAASLASATLLYAIGAKMFHRNVGLIAAAALAVNRIFVERGALAGNECLVVMFLLAAFLLILRYLERPSARLHAACGVLLGLAVATKYNGGIHALTLFAASVVVAWRDRGESSFARQLLAPRAWAGFPCALLAFVAGCPGVVLTFSEFWHDFRWQAAFLHEGHSLRDIEEATNGYLAYVLQFPRRNNGVPFAVLCGLGVLLAMVQGIRKRDVRHGLLLVAALPTYLFLGSGIFVEMRFLMVAIPFFLLLGAWALHAVASGALERLVAGRKEGRVAWEAAVPVLLGIALLAPHAEKTKAQFDRKYLQDSRAELLAWMLDNVDPGERYIDLCSPRTMRFFTATDVSMQIRPARLEDASSRERWQRNRREFYRSQQVIALLKKAEDFEAFRERLESGKERHIIVSMLCPPWKKDTPLSRVLRRALKNVPGRGAYTARNWSYWDEVIELLVGLEVVAHTVSRDKKGFICVLKLP